MSRQIISKSYRPLIAAQIGTGEFKEDPYLSKLIKLVPMEIISVYLTVFNLIKTNAQNPDNNILQWIVFSAVALITPLYLIKIAKITSLIQITLCFFSFCIWVFTIGGPLDGKIIAGYSPQFLGAIILPIYTLIIPMLYK